jgi:hypothetical protein
MERDALVSHGVGGFLKESMMERADKAQIRICNGCGTVPIFNSKQSLFVCTLCDGPARFIGTTANTLEILPTMERSSATTSIVEMPYATKLLGDELQTYLNMGMRILTAKSVAHLEQNVFTLPEGDLVRQALDRPLPQAILVDTRVPKYSEPEAKVEDAEEDLFALGHIGPEPEAEAEAEPAGQEEGQEESVAFGLPQESTTPQYGFSSPETTPQLTPQYAPATPPYAPNTPPYAPNTQPSTPVLLQPVFPSGMNSPAYAPTTPVQPVQQPVPQFTGVPQIVQQGGFQSRIIQEPFSRMNTIVIEGGPPMPPMQMQRGGQRQTRPAGPRQPAPPQNPNARITIRKIG